MKTRLLGRWGERIAADYLRVKKYSVIGMGYTTRFGEVDIIAEKHGYIVFVEVKLCRSRDFASAMEYVDSRKQHRIKMSAQIWLAENGDTDRPARFDVMEIYAPDGEKTGNPIINHIKNAF